VQFTARHRAASSPPQKGRTKLTQCYCNCTVFNSPNPEPRLERGLFFFAADEVIE